MTLGNQQPAQPVQTELTADGNRREFFRLSLLQEASFRLVAQERYLTESAPCVLIDISAGGARIAVRSPILIPRPLPDGIRDSDVDLEVAVQLLSPWRLRAKIVWEDLQPIEKIHRYGLEWKLLHHRQRDRLVGELMRLEIKKKKGI